MNEVLSLDFAPTEEQAGFRLHRLEVYNWGTFHGKVWAVRPGGANALLAGDIGSGKSTLVDALTTLLVPPQKVAYNKAAGAEARERTLRSYALGFYKSERGETGQGARPVALRDATSYSVVLAHFRNEGFSQDVTLAQVFWFKEPEGQPLRLYVVADRRLSIAENFADFGADILALRRRFRSAAWAELHDAFPAYSAAFRRRFGIESEQALNLFHQTVSMKSVGNLTDFVRQHMLEPCDVRARIQGLLTHFDDLSKAHQSVVKAREQIQSLRPLVAHCQAREVLRGEVRIREEAREVLPAYFAGLHAQLLEVAQAELAQEIARLEVELAAQEDQLRGLASRRDDVKAQIAQSGGDRLERIERELAHAEARKQERQRRADQYGVLAKAADLPRALDAESFLANRRLATERREAALAQLAAQQNEVTERNVAVRPLLERVRELEAELASLRSRRSNLPRQMLEMRANLVQTCGLDERELPFAGELIQVREEERDWEGAAERVLHALGTSLLVPDALYAEVAQWVELTHLGGRLIYYRVREPDARALELGPDSLARKVAIKPDSEHYRWLERHLAERFDYTCCRDLAQFRRAERAVTRSGQTKSGGSRHEKDDRHQLNDRSRFVLGWSNESKIAVLVREAEVVATRIQEHQLRLAALQHEQRAVREQVTRLDQLALFEDFRDLDWQPVAAEIERLQAERKQIEESSHLLRTLQDQLREVEAAIAQAQVAERQARERRAGAEVRRSNGAQLLQSCQLLRAEVTAEAAARIFPALEGWRAEAQPTRTLSLATVDRAREELRSWLQGRINSESAKVKALEEKILRAMHEHRSQFPLETREADASLQAAGEYESMLKALETDDLPRFEARFKELLNENTIREVANFQSLLHRERELITERIDTINRSLHAIDYNPGRFIRLEPELSADVEVRELQQRLRACTEGALTGSGDEEYSEAKFLEVKAIVERFQGRPGVAELDARWTAKVTDVRNWFTFSASERYREDGQEHEHYTDSGGKSGGQKEKLAYTVLAASLAYQFGLEWGARRSRSFRFAVIDEAFGRGSDESARYGLELFRRLNLQLLIVTPLQKLHVIEPFVAAVGFVHSEEGRLSMVRNLTIEEYRAERAARSG